MVIDSITSNILALRLAAKDVCILFPTGFETLKIYQLMGAFAKIFRTSVSFNSSNLVIDIRYSRY
jgi:hypothetical protein